MKIANFNIGNKKTFIIAEIGNNHNGCQKLAYQMIDSAIEAGADCVKFQMRNMDSVYRKKSLAKKGEDLGTEYILDLLKRFELSENEHREIADYCLTKNILYMCTPWDFKSIDVLEGFNVPAYKVASADLTNIPLIAKLVETKKPLILSTGMS
jgi:sialic acid synthase SpsE